MYTQGKMFIRLNRGRRVGILKSNDAKVLSGNPRKNFGIQSPYRLFQLHCMKWAFFTRIRPFQAFCLNDPKKR